MLDKSEKWGVIIMNLGTLSAPTKAGYRAFIKEFLSDPRVVEIPRIAWWPILNLFILPFRPAKIIGGYEKIWDETKGFPLTYITQSQSEKLQSKLQLQLGKSAPTVTYAMTYGQPKLAERVNELKQSGVEKIFVLPLYPQYSATTTASIYDQYSQLISESRDIPDITINKSYYQRDDYIEALVNSIRSYRQDNGASERLLLSFHGIPKRCVDLGDPYFKHCEATANAVAAGLNLRDDEWGISFQSRLGKATWLQPYTFDVLQQWGKDGIKTVDVACPAFAADCLETLEEIAFEGKEVFLEAQGENLRLIPCLNDSDIHIEVLANIVRQRLGH
ncbi:ferrochelatase [Aurantivibrio infirmus]